MKGGNAATLDVPVLQAVLTLSANFCPTQAANERQFQLKDDINA
jgi:hypothetical protein